jgi:hypothetical protein
MSPRKTRKIEEDVKIKDLSNLFELWIERIYPSSTSYLDINDKKGIHVYQVAGSGPVIYYMEKRDEFTKKEEFTSLQDCVSYLFDNLKNEELQKLYGNLRARTKQPIPIQENYLPKINIEAERPVELDLKSIRSMIKSSVENVSKLKDVAAVLGVPYPVDIDKDPEKFGVFYELIQKEIEFHKIKAQTKLPKSKDVETIKDLSDKRLKHVVELAGKIGINYTPDINTNPKTYQSVLSQILNTIQGQTVVRQEISKIGEAKDIIEKSLNVLTTFFSEHYNLFKFYTIFPELKPTIDPFLEKIEPAYKYQELINTEGTLEGDVLKQAMEYEEKIIEKAADLIPEAVEISKKIRNYVNKNRMVKKWIKLRQAMIEAQTYTSVLIGYKEVFDPDLGVKVGEKFDKLVAEMMSAKLSELNPILGELGEIAVELYNRYKPKK